MIYISNMVIIRTIFTIVIYHNSTIILKHLWCIGGRDGVDIFFNQTTPSRYKIMLILVILIKAHTPPNLACKYKSTQCHFKLGITRQGRELSEYESEKEEYNLFAAITQKLFV